MKYLKLFTAMLLYFIINQANAKVVDYENDWSGRATLISINGNYVTLSVKRESGTSITIIDCKKGLVMDERYDKKFTETDRQSPELVYFDDFCYK